MPPRTTLLVVIGRILVFILIKLELKNAISSAAFNIFPLLSIRGHLITRGRICRHTSKIDYRYRRTDSQNLGARWYLIPIRNSVDTDDTTYHHPPLPPPEINPYDGNNPSYISNDEIMEAYSSWRAEYGNGDFESVLFENFKINYSKLISINFYEKKIARERGLEDPILMTLNQYGDCSTDEFTAEKQHLRVIAERQNRKYSGCFSMTSIKDQNRIRQVYWEWCYKHQQEHQESRLDIFAFNLKVVENYFLETGKMVELNKYADLSPDEYKSMIAVGSMTRPAVAYSQSQYTGNSYLSKLSSTAKLQTLSFSSNQYQELIEVEQDTIKHIYKEWCAANGKECIKSRLEIFATNFIAIEKYRSETGKNIKLSKYAHLSQHEYNAMTSMKAFYSFEKQVGTERKKYRKTSNKYKNIKSLNGNSYLEQLANVSLEHSKPFFSEYDKKINYEDHTKETNHLVDQRAEKITLSHSKRNSKQDHQHDQQHSEISLSDSSEGLGDFYPWCQYYGEKTTNDKLCFFINNCRSWQQHYHDTEQEVAIDLNSELRRNSDYQFEQLIQDGNQGEKDVGISVKKKTDSNYNILFDQKQLTDISRLIEDNTSTGVAKRASHHVDTDNDFKGKEKFRMLEDLRADQACLEKIQKQGNVARMELNLTRNQLDLDEALKVYPEIEEPLSNTTYDTEVDKSSSDVIVVPRTPYLSAVAKTWFDRSSYLEALQQGKTGVLPDLDFARKFSENKEQKRVEVEMAAKLTPGSSLIKTTWEFIKGNKNDAKLATEQYSKRLIQQTEKSLKTQKN